MRKTLFVNEQFYHIYNRGVDKRKIFQSPDDYERFIKSLFYFNDINILGGLHLGDLKIGASGPGPDSRERLVDIIAWCLMPNHFHLILRQRQDGGVSKFLQKLVSGYTTYFNIKNDRSGVLLQGAFKSKHIQTDSYLMHAVRYVHLNPVAIIEPQWETRGIKDWKGALKFLDLYRWSSHSDYTGVENFSSLIHKEHLPHYSTLTRNYVQFLSQWLLKNRWFERFRT